MRNFIYAITGKKDSKMLSIERRFPGVKGFNRRCSFITAIGSRTIWYENGWIMFLPVRQAFEWRESQYAWSFNFFIIAGYISKYNRKVVTT